MTMGVSPTQAVDAEQSEACSGCLCTPCRCGTQEEGGPLPGYTTTVRHPHKLGEAPPPPQTGKGMRTGWRNASGVS